jgi:hypothetical protein
VTVRFVADENLNRNIVRGLQCRTASLDIVRVQDVGLRTADDPAVLEWAASQRRALLTRDFAAMADFAYGRVANRLRMPGAFMVRRDMAIAAAIDELILVADASLDGEWEGRVRYLPLR